METLNPIRDFNHFRWTMPGGLPQGPSNPLVFSIINTEMPLSESPEFIKGLEGILHERNLKILRQATKNLLANPKHGPAQLHMFVFISAQSNNPAFLTAGANVLFGLLEKNWPNKTISLIAVSYDFFCKLELMATKEGYNSGPPPSLN